MKNIPEKIYLQIDADGETPEDFEDLKEVSWCADRINENDLEYVLNDREERKWFTFEMFRKELIEFALAYHKSDQKDISNDASEWAYQIFNKV